MPKNLMLKKLLQTYKKPWNNKNTYPLTAKQNTENFKHRVL